MNMSRGPTKKKSPGKGRGFEALSLSSRKAPAQGGKAGDEGLAAYHPRAIIGGVEPLRLKTPAEKQSQTLDFLPDLHSFTQF
jgi:hypothetical protein